LTQYLTIDSRRIADDGNRHRGRAIVVAIHGAILGAEFGAILGTRIIAGAGTKDVATMRIALISAAWFLPTIVLATRGLATLVLAAHNLLLTRDECNLERMQVARVARHADPECVRGEINGDRAFSRLPDITGKPLKGIQTRELRSLTVQYITRIV
jgi:hypothetical protein